MYPVKVAFLLSVVLPAQGEGGCRDLTFLDCVKNKALVGHVINSFKVLVPGLETCQHKCFLEGKCVSYNLGPIEGLGRSCELSDGDNLTHPGHVVQQQQYEYCPIKNPCSSYPCPDKWSCRPVFTFDTYKCEVCKDPLGMQDGRIIDSQITASTFFDQRFQPWLARLHQKSSRSHQGSWVAAKTAVGEYVQIDLGTTSIVSKVATQGRVPADYHTQWVTKYSLSYSDDGSTWTDYKENDSVKEFKANSDKVTVVANDIQAPFKTRFARVIVKEFHEQPAMRVELYGCRL